jgi:hypothetical protein
LAVAVASALAHFSTALRTASAIVMTDEEKTDWGKVARKAWNAPSWKEAAKEYHPKVTNGGAKPEALPPPSIEELEATAGDLIDCPDILARFGTEVESAGLVGETNNAKILYLTLTSRLFERPVSIAIKGVSSGGKSVTVERVLEFFPPAAYSVRTGLSEKALIYSDEDFRHRTLVIYEAAGMNSDMLSYLIRTLLSEGRLVYELVEKTKAGIRPRKIEKEGPTGLITTTTASKLHPENETRLLSLGVIDTRMQTEAVMRALAADAETPINYVPWRALQTWLATGERRVFIPFAIKLAEQIPGVAVRLRRDFKLLLTLIRSHALLHRNTRSKDDHDRIVATLADYAAVRGLIERLFSEGVEAKVPKTVRETVEAVAVLCRGQSNTATPAEVSLTALAKELKLDKGPTSHRVRKAIDRGFLVNREEKRGKPARIVIGDPLPDEIQILPEVSALEECCSVAAVPEGHNRESEESATEVEIKAETAPPYLPPGQHYNTATLPPDDYPDFPKALRRDRCDHCGTLGASGRYDWPGRPFGVVLHSSCEGAWFDSERRL